MSLMLSEHSDFLFDAVRNNISGITNEEMRWIPIPESNTIQSILVHTVRIAYLLIPQVIKGKVNSDGWDDDYEETTHTYEELLSDFDKARTQVVNGIKGMSRDDLESTVKMWGRDLVRKQFIFHLLREVAHHNGQIAMLKGMYKRTHS